MAEDFGNGVTRTLSALQRQFQLVVWQAGKPPLDSELNLMAQVDWERLREVVRSQMHSGFLADPTNALEDFDTAEAWSNFFKLGKQNDTEEGPVLWANVNGWVIPVTGTAVLDADVTNKITLNPPPSSDSRIDFIFLEAWATNVAPNPSVANKPSADKVWKYGNVEFGGTNIDDDIEDTTIGFETTERVQVQYRIRVFGSGAGLGSSVDLAEFPDGLGDPNILGQGAASATVLGTPFANMREELDDAVLWRAGDGDPTNALGTIDGFTYAIPICALFRRNSAGFSAVETSGNANHNGSYDRNPSAATLAEPREGAKVLNTPTLTNGIDADDLGIIQVTNLTDSGIDDALHTITALFLDIDGEIIQISNVDTSTSPGTVTIPTGGRGRNATMARPHGAGSVINIFNARPDNKYADEIHEDDILDLRRAVTLGDWDYQRLLIHNLTKLIKGTLKSSYKQSAEGDTQGPSVVEVSYLYANGAASEPNQTEPLDGPDGIRTVFSDAASIQTDVTVLLDQNASQAAGFVSSFDSTVQWGVGADFKPGGFMTSNSGFDVGSTIFLYIGGDAGTEGARATFRDGGTRAVRFLSPQEYWLSDTPVQGEQGNQAPVSMRFLSESLTAMGEAPGEDYVFRPGPLLPQRGENFERPFIFLGGILNTSSQVGGAEVYNDSPSVGEFEVRLPGLNFDQPGAWFSKSVGQFVNDPTVISNPVLREQRTLYDMITAGGTDRTGASSEVYLLLFGDDADASNNGAFKVIGAGASAGYTNEPASASDRVRVVPLTTGNVFVSPGAAALTGELRSQFTNAEDGTGFASSVAAAAVCITEPNIDRWTALAMPQDSKMALNLTLQYHPGRSGMARVPGDIWRVAAVNAGGEYLRQSPASVDGTFPGLAGTPDNETNFPPTHVQTWNRLEGRGQVAPNLLTTAGGKVVLSSEQDRDTECFFDSGSKTLVYRPFQSHLMTMHTMDLQATSGSFLGPLAYPGPVPTPGTPKDGANIFTPNLELSYEVPAEYMPRFGRQDIPYHQDVSNPLGSGTFLSGINHLFTDSTDPTEPQFYVIGGQDNNSSGNLVSSLFMQTGATSGLAYCEYGTIVGTTTPGYQGRLMSDDQVASSDLGRGLKGIELPPYLGIARLYGVYDRRDFVDKGGDTFETDRITPKPGTATNLLRTDVDKQTLFIRQDGAEDITGEVGDHTYIIPQDALDITLSPFFTSGEEFADLEYVVECVVFGFSRGFISLNNFVLARHHNGAGATISDGTPGSIDGDVIELDGVDMCIPSAAPLNSQVYVGYNRIPYQGDPYMTRAGSVRTITDYEARYGQVPPSSAIELDTSIQQFDANGDTIPETPNARSLQVLAALDFYTTLGSGKVAGNLFPGTSLDVGFTEPSYHTRIPDSLTDPAARVLSRAFSEGQRESSSRATISVTVEAYTFIPSGTVVRVVRGDGASISLVEGADWVAATSNATTAASIATAIGGAIALDRAITADSAGTATVTVTAVPVGDAGNQIFLEVTDILGLTVNVRLTNDAASGRVTGGFLSGGIDLAVNGGNGTSQINLTGMIERLPLGILLQDSDFLCEDPLASGSSAMATQPAGIQQVQTILGLTGESDTEYTRFLGGPGQWVGMADGGILKYGAFTDSTPTGTKKFRLYRGGGSSYVLTPPEPGGPIDWVSGSFQKNLTPVLKGGVLVCKALLVRNFVETAFTTDSEVSPGDEVQMVILTHGILGDGATQTEGVELSGVISPTGFGEGYSASDRYRLEGKPMVAGKVRQPQPTDADLALFLGEN
ncbi:baseplate J/gp47 family protein [Deltaproteobacteria bacterium]|nr:baseplate J/gp47 family protein [Deltaproteobacteria bacterium]